MQPITKTITNDPADFRSVTYFNVFFRRVGYLPLLIIFWALSVLLWVLKFWSGLQMAPMLLVSSLLMLLLPPALVISTEMKIRKYQKSDNFYFGSSQTYTVDETGITLEGGPAQVSAGYQWAMFHMAYELKNHFLIYLNESQVIILPKRAYSREEILSLRRCFADHLGSNFQLRHRSL